MSVWLWINMVFKDESKFAMNTFGICMLSTAVDHSPLVRVSTHPTSFVDVATEALDVTCGGHVTW